MLAFPADVCEVGPPEGRPDLRHPDVSPSDHLTALRAFPDWIAHLKSGDICSVFIITFYHANGQARPMNG